MTATPPTRAKRKIPPRPVTVAAIIPLYNGALWIEEALASVLAQTVLPDEIIIVDDGSTDEGPEMVRRITAGNRRVRIVEQLNAGQSAARNLAISLTTCEFVALIDQDDLWYPNHIEELVLAVQEHTGLRLGWAYTDFDDIDLDGRMVARDFIQRTPTDNPKRDLIKILGQGVIIQPSATLILRQAILDVGGFDVRLSGYEDDDLFLRIFMANYDNVFIPVPTSQWRIHETSSGASDRTEDSLRIYGAKLIEMFPNDRWRGHYFRRDLIAPRMINTWMQMYVRASRYHNTKKMRVYAREAQPYVRYLRPRSRVAIGMMLLILRQPVFIRFRTATVDNDSIAWAPLVALGRRLANL